MNKNSLKEKVMTKLAETSLGETNARRNNFEVFVDLLGRLQYMAMWYQSCHWLSKADSYYGDHLLFQRIYEGEDGGGITEEIDMIGERAIVAGGEASVNRMNLLKAMSVMESEVQKMVKSGKDCVSISLMLEDQFLSRLAQHSERVSMGTKALLDNLADNHETNIYLLSRRSLRG
jgi:DNA-binding ferritin-like protein